MNEATTGPGYAEALRGQGCRRAVVLVSGRRDGDAALAYAAALAAERGIELIAVHVDAAGGRLERAAHYADAPHHEYPAQLDEFVRRAVPGGSEAERAAITDIVLCHGEPASALRAVMAERGADLLIVGARAAREPGIDELLSDAERPVLVVRAPGREPFRLKVGKWLE